MTLSELLRKVAFNELIPTLKGVYDMKDIYSSTAQMTVRIPEEKLAEK